MEFRCAYDVWNELKARSFDVLYTWSFYSGDGLEMPFVDTELEVSILAPVVDYVLPLASWQ